MEILQARILKGVAKPFSRRSSLPIPTQGSKLLSLSSLAGGFFTTSDSWKAPWGVRAYSRGQQQAKWLDLPPLPAWCCSGLSLVQISRGSREKQSGQSRETVGASRPSESSLLPPRSQLTLAPTAIPLPLGGVLVLDMHFLQPPGLCLPSSAADFLPTKEKTEDSEQ